VEDEDTGEVDRHVEQVTKVLAEHSWICSSFTARESRAARRRILDDFRLGNIDALVAIKCLDEGIDIPACRTAFLLASSRNPKQFIQRRGRILRRSEGKEYAIIHDFLVRPPPGNSEQTTADRNLVKSELLRVTNFSKLSIDPGKATKALLPTLIEYDLAHMLV
jgi:superfamily II DNA or RNA helicase